MSEQQLEDVTEDSFLIGNRKDEEDSVTSDDIFINRVVKASTDFASEDRERSDENEDMDINETLETDPNVANVADPERTKVYTHIAHHIPKDRAAWLEFLVGVVRRKTNIEYLNDRELKKVIVRARPNLSKKTFAIADKDAPICANWSCEEVADWIEEMGYPHIGAAFKLNGISGRRLILVDASALNKMGMQDIRQIKEVAKSIRDLLGIPMPNVVRALMRIPPFESHLRKKVYQTEDLANATFENYCKSAGFPYDYLVRTKNKNAEIPCTCEVNIVPLDANELDDDECSEDDDMSLLSAPTVEFVVRNMRLGDLIVASIIETMIDNVFVSSGRGGVLSNLLKDGLEKASGMSDESRLQLAKAIAESLVDELERTALILNDIEELQRYIQEYVSPEQLKHLQECAREFTQNLVPIISLLSLGDLDLEAIFQQEPFINAFVDTVVEEAEQGLKEIIPAAEEAVDYAISEGQTEIMKLAKGTTR